MKVTQKVCLVRTAKRHVRFVPIADIRSRSANADRSGQSGFMDCD